MAFLSKSSAFCLALLFCIFLQGCADKLMPISNALSAYDAYSIWRDRRHISTITLDKLAKLRVQAAIAKSKDFSNFDIDVECFYGHIYLIGLVQNRSDIARLVELAKQASGAESVSVYFKQKGVDYGCIHTVLFANLKAKLYAKEGIEGTAIRLSIVGCDVVFTGVVDSKAKIQKAVSLAKQTKGVVNVKSFLVVAE